MRSGAFGLVLAAAGGLVASCTVSNFVIDPASAGRGRYSTAPAAPGWERWPPPFMVAVMTHAQYEVAHYHHEVVGSSIPADSASPTGFALLPGGRGTVLERRSENIRGTGLVLRRDGNTVLILTCLHVVDFPPVVRTEISSGLTSTGRLLIGVAQRKAQQTFIGRPGQGQVTARIAAYSEQDDLAILKADGMMLGPHLLPIPYDLGDAEALRPGDGVYLLGAPRGSFQVSWGVATPQEEGTFIVGTATPPGFSGGAALSTVRSTGAFELLGIVTGTGGQRVKVWGYEDSVLPGSTLDEIDPKLVVAGDFKSFDFGITYCATTDRIRSLLERAGVRIQRLPELEVPVIVPQSSPE